MADSSWEKKAHRPAGAVLLARRLGWLLFQASLSCCCGLHHSIHHHCCLASPDISGANCCVLLWGCKYTRSALYGNVCVVQEHPHMYAVLLLCFLELTRDQGFVRMLRAPLGAVGQHGPPHRGPYPYICAHKHTTKQCVRHAVQCRLCAGLCAAQPLNCSVLRVCFCVCFCVPFMFGMSAQVGSYG